MSIRWRSDGRLVCAAMSSVEDGDSYIDDRLHYQLSVVSKSIVAATDHETSGLWYWIHSDGPWLRGVPE